MSVMWKEKSIKIFFTGAATTSIVVVGLIFLFLGKEAAPFLFSENIVKLFGTEWVPVSFEKEQFGMLPLITGSFLVTFLAILFAVPFGVLSAVYLSEIANKTEQEMLKPLIELLAGIPSVVIGFFGIIALSPILKNTFGLESGLNALNGAILLALMATPTIITISDDAIRSVPSSYKQASIALGGSKLQTIWRVVVPDALSGIIAAVMLGIGRVIGETMTVLMVTGNAAIITASPFDSVRTMTATIAAEMGEVAFGSDHYRVLFCVGIILLLITFGLNMIAQKVLRRRSV